MKPSMKALMHTTKYLSRSTTLRIGALVSSFYQHLESGLTFFKPIELDVLPLKVVIGCTIYENPFMNLQ